MEIGKEILYEFLVNGCLSSICQNGGQCVPSTTNCSSTTCPINCICLNGTTGRYCEMKDTSCSTMTCLNGGTCLITNQTKRPYCQCPFNTTGSR